MAGWLKIADGHALDCLRFFHKQQTKELSFGFDSGLEASAEGAEEDKVRCLFDRFLSVFLREICGVDCLRPLPPMLGDGKPVDVFKLYLSVREKGGFETVSINGLWDSVAEESGLGSDAGSSVKLIYVKYLDTLDRWLQKIVKDSTGILETRDRDMSCSLMELESNCKGVQASDPKKKDREFADKDLEKARLNSANLQILRDGNGDLGNVKTEECVENASDDKSTIGDNGGNLVTDSSEEISERKRKRENEWRMLQWVVEVAKNPCDPEVESLPERSKWKHCGNEQLWKQVLLAREAMFLKRSIDLGPDQSASSWLKKQKMHPSMYEDQEGTERLRCSPRILSAKESRTLHSSKMSQTGLYSESSSGTQSDLDDQVDKQSDSSCADPVIASFDNKRKRKRVPVGRCSQAEIPEWNGEDYKSDPKWLGARVWPLKSCEQNKYLIERDRIGKGRQDSCGCQLPGSIECVRFHVNEKRMRVRLELCSAFHHWKFDEMGEDVALSWTEEEEAKFHKIVKSNTPSLEKSFWTEIFKSFPRKSREELVSYYFNVFLLQRRSQQNRSTPSDIDSDDDESFGPYNSFGQRTTNSPGSILCSPKKPHLNPR